MLTVMVMAMIIVLAHDKRSVCGTHRRPSYVTSTEWHSIRTMLCGGQP
jgi:hypothetical protein